MQKGKSWKRKKEESEDDTDIYSSDVRESMLEDDELAPFEEAFLAGYEEIG